MLPERLAAMHPAMQHFIDEGKLPNVVTLVARRGRIVHFEAQGFTDLESKHPVGTDTIFRLYSNTKPITGVAAMILVEEGKLRLDDPVSRFIPSFADLQVRVPGQPLLTEPPNRPLTIRHCLTHTTGLANPANVPVLYAGADALWSVHGLFPGPSAHRQALATLRPVSDGGSGDRRERVEALAALPMHAHPGERWDYHIGFVVMSVVLEEACGMPLDEFYKTRIFEPLGMQDSDFYLSEDKIGRFASCYRPECRDGVWQLALQDEPATSEKVTGDVSGEKQYFDAGGDAGGVLSTVGDYARFGQMLLNGGELDGVRIVGPKSVEIMASSHTDLISPMSGPEYGWGLGVSVRVARGSPTWRSIGSYGWGGAAGTRFFVDPAQELVAVCFTQVLNNMIIPGNTYREDFERIIYQSLA